GERHPFFAAAQGGHPPLKGRQVCPRGGQPVALKRRAHICHLPPVYGGRRQVDPLHLPPPRRLISSFQHMSAHAPSCAQKELPRNRRQLQRSCSKCFYPLGNNSAIRSSESPKVRCRLLLAYSRRREMQLRSDS